MHRVATLAYLLGLGAAVIVPAGLATYGWRRRREPGALAFTALVTAFALYAALHLVGVLTPDPGWRLFWEVLQLTITAVTPVLWIVFALDYTGFDEYVTRRSVAVLSVVPVVTIVGLWTNPLHGLFFGRNEVVLVDGLAIMHQQFGVLFWLLEAYILVAILVGIVLHARLVFATDDLYLGQGVVLVLGILFVPLSSAASVWPTPDGTPRLDYTQFGFAVTSLAFGYAVFRHRLLDLVPAPRRMGRRSAIGALDEGIAVLDDGEVIYCNAAAARVLGVAQDEALGASIADLIDQPLTEAPDAVGELVADDRVYELRSSPIRDRRDNRIGTTVVFHDVTARIEHERELAAQRDELATVNELNRLIRSVNQATVAATSREEIEDAVCQRLVAGDLYRTARFADLATWNGEADRWCAAGDASVPVPTGQPPEAGTAQLPATPTAATNGDAGGGWTLVPVRIGRTVYGALGLYTDRTDVSERERAVLGELGAHVGHAINAVETRHLLSAESVVALELACTDDGDPLVALTAGTDWTVSVSGLVPGGTTTIAYLRVEGTTATAAADRLDTLVNGRVRVIDDHLVEWTVATDAPLSTLVEYGTNLEGATAHAGEAEYAVAVASEERTRQLVQHLSGRFPATEVVAKRTRTGPVEEPAAIPANSIEGLTDRQREVIETAYRAGYFNWPRDSTAEEVADSLDISAPTLHAHLRKAESSLLGTLFESLDGGRRPFGAPAEED